MNGLRRCGTCIEWNTTQPLKTEECHLQQDGWMQLEILILSEVNQKEKDKYHMTLLPKLCLCPPVLNRKMETEFWMKEEKNSFYCFGRQRRPQQAKALKTVPSLGEELQEVL